MSESVEQLKRLFVDGEIGLTEFYERICAIGGKEPEDLDWWRAAEIRMNLGPTKREALKS